LCNLLNAMLGRKQILSLLLHLLPSSFPSLNATSE
jgi:hypothetical protein